MQLFSRRRQNELDLRAGDFFDCQNVFRHGFFQHGVAIFASLSMLVLHCHTQAFTLVSRDLDHWCRPPSDVNMSLDAWKKVAIPLEADGTLSHCLVYSDPGNPNNTETVTCSEWDYDPEVADNTLVSYWNLVCNRHLLVALADAVYSAGALAAMGIASNLVENVGRKPIIFTALIVLLLATLGITFADTYIVYVTTRFLNSGCATTVFVISQTLLFEVSTNSHRALTMVLAFAFGDVGAEFWFDFLHQLRLNWHQLQATILSPTLLLMSAYLVIYESPRWLVYKRRMREAEAVMKAAARKNGLLPSEAQAMADKIHEEIAKSKPIEIKHPDEPSFNDIRRYTIVMTITYFSATFAFYGTLQSPLARHEGRIRFTASAVAALWFLMLVCAIDRLSHPQLTTVLFAILGSLSALMSVSSESHDVHAVLFIVTKGCSQATLLMNIILILELFPTPLRCQAQYLTFACGRVAAVLASLLQVLSYAGREGFVLGIMAILAFVSMLLLRCIPVSATFRLGSEVGSKLDNRKTSCSTLQNLESMKETLEPVAYRKKGRKTRSCGRASSMSGSPSDHPSLPNLSSPSSLRVARKARSSLQSPATSPTRTLVSSPPRTPGIRAPRGWD